MIDNKDSYILSPLILLSCTVSHHTLLDRQKKQGVHPKVYKSKLKVKSHDRSNYFICNNDDGKIVSSCAVMGSKLLTLPRFADMYTFRMNTWNTLPECKQQKMHNNSLATVKSQIQQAEEPMPTVVLSMEAVWVVNGILLDYVTSEVVLEEPDI